MGQLSGRHIHRANAERVLITTVPFGAYDRGAVDRLDAEGVDYVINPTGRRLRESELTDLIRGFRVLIAGTEPITARVMDAAPDLRLISRVGIGLDSVDLLAARERGIHVSYTPDAPAPAVAELALGLMLSLLREIAPADRGLHSGAWRRFMGRRLDGLTIGVIGVGRVGRLVIRLLRGGFPSTRILAHDLCPDTEFGSAMNVTWHQPETIYREADIVTLHVPLTPATRDLIKARELAMMKPTALLVNTARGPIVNERDLVDALRQKRLRGAAIDVFSEEPYTGELTQLENALLTCHMGSMSEDCRGRMEVEATDEAIRFLKNEPLIRAVPDHEYALATPAQPPVDRM